MTAEWFLAGGGALAVSLLTIWASLGLLGKQEARWRRMAWMALALAGAVVGAIIGLLAVTVWQLTPGTDSCAGCDSISGVIGLVAMCAGAGVGIAVAVEAGRRRIDPRRDQTGSA